MPTAQAVDVRNLIGGSGAEASYGITPAAYADSRRLLADAGGDLYAVPGSTGLCLAFTTSDACGDPTVGRPLVVLLRTDANGNAIGGGIVGPGISSVTLASRDGASHTFDSPRGYFVVTSKDGVSMMGAPFVYTTNK
jgi:hypothetical protein